MSLRFGSGSRLRLGAIQASVNTLAEPEMQAMMPDGVYIHTTRLKLAGSSDEEILAMAARAEEAAMLLADVEPARILFHCTAASTFGTDTSEDIAARITAATGIAADSTSDCVLAALAALGARRIVMATPYIRAINEREARYFAAKGVTVVDEFGLGLPGGRAFARVQPAEWRRLLGERRNAAADAYFISCANVRATEAIEDMESDLGRPVVTSNQAAVWRLLRQCDIGDAIAGFGTLLRDF